MAGDFSIKWKGLDKVKLHFANAKKKELIKKAVKVNGTEMQAKMVKNTSLFTGTKDSRGNRIPGTPTGATKRSITGSVEDDGLTYTAGPKTEYAPYPNFGTRFMEARPFVTNAFNDQKGKFIEDVRRAMK